MERNRKLKETLARWYAAETTESEEQWLRETLLRESAEEEYAAERILFEGFGALAEERFEAGARRPQSLPLPPPARPRWRRWLPAAAAAVLLIGWVAAWQLRSPYCYIDGKPVYDRQLALSMTDCLEELEGLSALDAASQKLLNQLLNHTPEEL